MRLTVLALFLFASAALAQEDFSNQLGDDVYWVPQVEINFKSSEFKVIQGEKVGKDGLAP